MEKGTQFRCNLQIILSRDETTANLPSYSQSEQNDLQINWELIPLRAICQFDNLQIIFSLPRQKVKTLGLSGWTGGNQESIPIFQPLINFFAEIFLHECEINLNIKDVIQVIPGSESIFFNRNKNRFNSQTREVLKFC